MADSHQSPQQGGAAGARRAGPRGESAPGRMERLVSSIALNKIDTKLNRLEARRN